MIQDWQCESRRLAGARLRDADDIAALTSKGNGLSLNGSGSDVFFFCKGTKNRRCEAEVGKCIQRVSFLYGETAVLPFAAGGIAGLKDIPRDQGCRFGGETEEAGRNSF